LGEWFAQGLRWIKVLVFVQTAKGSADLLALPVRGRMPRHVRRRKSLKMKEPGNRPMSAQARLRLIFGQDAQ
jgi:hypothetical protein